MAKQITQFNRANLKTLRTDIDNALEAVLAKHGLSGSIGRISFSANEFKTRLTVGTGSTDDTAERTFKENACRFGLTGDEFGKSFTQGSTKFTIVGMKPRNHKYPIIAENAKGTSYKFPASYAENAK